MSGAASDGGAQNAARRFPYGICVFDIDGTLKGSGGFTKRTLAALRSARERGAAVVLATGLHPQGGRG